MVEVLGAPFPVDAHSLERGGLAAGDSHLLPGRRDSQLADALQCPLVADRRPRGVAVGEACGLGSLPTDAVKLEVPAPAAALSRHDGREFARMVPLTDGGSETVVGNAGAVESLTARQRLFVVALAIFVASTRLLAVSHSMWDWDEALFASGLRHYDVAQHHPHPPGFPLFFAFAKLARLVLRDDFHALRAISVLASFFIFPAIFALARSLRFRFRTCVVASLLFCFLPNVWYWEVPASPTSWRW